MKTFNVTVSVDLTEKAAFQLAVRNNDRISKSEKQIKLDVPAIHGFFSDGCPGTRYCRFAEEDTRHYHFRLKQSILDAYSIQDIDEPVTFLAMVRTLTNYDLDRDKDLRSACAEYLLMRGEDFDEVTEEIR